jgi:hypothetical protein
MLGALLGMGLRYGPRIIRGIGKAIGYGRKIGQGIDKAKKIGSILKAPAQAAVSGLYGADSNESQKFNKYSDKAEKGLNTVSSGLNEGLKRADNIKSAAEKYSFRS